MATFDRSPNLEDGIRLVYNGPNYGRQNIYGPKYKVFVNGQEADNQRLYTYVKGKPFYVDSADVNFLLSVTEKGFGPSFDVYQEEEAEEEKLDFKPEPNPIEKAWQDSSLGNDDQEEPDDAEEPPAKRGLTEEEEDEAEARAIASEAAMREADAANVNLRDVLASLETGTMSITVHHVRNYLKAQAPENAE